MPLLHRVFRLVTVMPVDAVDQFSHDFLAVYRGSPGAYAAVEATWSRGQEGLNAVFTTTVSGLGDRLKLQHAEGQPIFVTAISFGSD